MCNAKTIGTIISPVDALAPKSGVGQIFAPAAFAGRKIGGQMGAFIDPANALRDPDRFREPTPTPKAATKVDKGRTAPIRDLPNRGIAEGSKERRGGVGATTGLHIPV